MKFAFRKYYHDYGYETFRNYRRDRRSERAEKYNERYIKRNIHYRARKYCRGEFLILSRRYEILRSYRVAKAHHQRQKGKHRQYFFRFYVTLA